LEIVLNSEQFKKFVNCLSILKDNCNDVDIKEGVIRQHINSRYCIFELDLTSLINNLSIPIVGIKKKLDILKTFKNSEEITIDVDDTTYSFSDNYSRIKFNKLPQNMLDNEYINDDELGHMFILNPDDLILNCEINKTISARIKSISQNFDVNTFKILFNENKASIISTSQDKNQEATLLSDIEIPREMNCITNVFTTPFIIDHDDNMSFELYEVQENTCMGKIKTSISEVNVVIYTNAILVDDEDDYE